MYCQAPLGQYELKSNNYRLDFSEAILLLKSSDFTLEGNLGTKNK